MYGSTPPPPGGRYTADVSNHLVRRLFCNITLDVHYSVCSVNKILRFECVSLALTTVIGTKGGTTPSCRICPISMSESRYNLIIIAFVIGNTLPQNRLGHCQQLVVDSSGIISG